MWYCSLLTIVQNEIQAFSRSFELSTLGSGRDNNYPRPPLPLTFSGIKMYGTSSAFLRLLSNNVTWSFYLIYLSPPLQYVRIDSDDEGECEEPLFPGEGEVTDAAIVLLRKKMSGKYTLFKVSSQSKRRCCIFQPIRCKINADGFASFPALSRKMTFPFLVSVFPFAQLQCKLL